MCSGRCTISSAGHASLESSLCDGIARPWFDAHWQVDTLEVLEVPLKVYAVTSGLTRKSQAWLDFLTAEEGLALYDPPKKGYAAWQRLEILRCRPRT